MVLVVKVGGALAYPPPDHLVEDIVKVAGKERLVLVHGGAREVTRVAEAMGVKQRFIVSPSGFRSRYTDRETMEIFLMVMAGRVNKELVSRLCARGLRALGLTGVDGSLIKAVRKRKLIVVEKGRKRVIDGGYTGRIKEVNTHLLDRLLKLGVTPVIAPVAMGEEGEPLNVDADRVAAYVAGSIKAEEIVVLTDVEGLIVNGKLVSRVSAGELDGYIKLARHGMRRKLYAAKEALNMGVKRVVIASGLKPNPVSTALKHESCTVIEP